MARLLQDEKVNVGDKVKLIDDKDNQNLIKRIYGLDPTTVFNTIYTIKGSYMNLILTELNIDGYLCKIRFERAKINLMDLTYNGY